MTENVENKTQQSVNLSIDDGLEQIIINNRFGNEIGVFWFRPTDAGIIDRYNKTITALGKIVDTAQKVGIVPPDIDADPSDVAKATADAINTVKEELYKAFDYLFDANVAEAFFKKVHPFTIVNGRFFCEIVLEAIGGYLAKRLDSEVKKLNVRVERYTHGYRSGKHKNGRKQP